MCQSISRFGPPPTRGPRRGTPLIRMIFRIHGLADVVTGTPGNGDRPPATDEERPQCLAPAPTGRTAELEALSSPEHVTGPATGPSGVTAEPSPPRHCTDSGHPGPAHPRAVGSGRHDPRAPRVEAEQPTCACHRPVAGLAENPCRQTTIRRGRHTRRKRRRAENGRCETGHRN